MNKESDKYPLVSVIIPSYNSGEYIERTLKSVLNQSYEKFEIIIVDDESTDDTYKIIEAAAGLDNRIKPYRITHSGRPSVPRNYGISKASGSLIAFLDSDDLWTKRKLEYQVNYLGQHPEISFVYSMCFTFGEVNFWKERYEILPLPFRAVKNNKGLVEVGNTIPISSVLIRKEPLLEVEGFDEDPDLKAVEDYDLWLRLSSRVSFHFIPRLHVYYRIHSSQSSADWGLQGKRLRILEAKRGIKLPRYRGIARKGLFPRIIRNTIHFKFYVFYKITGYLENGDRL